MHDRPNALSMTLRLLLAGLILAPSAAVNADDVDQAMQALLERMTLTEKVGQLNLVPGGRSKNLNSKIDDAERQRVRDGRVGAYLHVAGAAFLGELQRVAVNESRLGIPLLFGTDIVHGYRTVFPVPLAMAASWDDDVPRDASRIAATEAAASGLQWTFAPMIDIARDPRWGRIVEGAGADPYLGSRMAVAQVEGFQGQSLADADTILATAKHFGAYGAASGGRDYDSADLSQRALQEIYLPPFYAAADAGAGAFMSAFNDLAGVPATASQRLLTGTLRDSWGYRGFVVSDWNAIAELVQHGVAADRGDAAEQALIAGVDMDMSALAYDEFLAAGIEAQPELETILDRAVLRVLAAKQALGLFDTPMQYHDPARERTELLSAEHAPALIETWFLGVETGPAVADDAPLAPHFVPADPEFAELIDTAKPIEKLADGFTWSEGPVWVGDADGYLLFSDVPENTLYRWDASDGVSVFMHPSGYRGPHPEMFREPGSNGLNHSAQAGTILMADHGTRSIERLDLTTHKKTVIADRYDGLPFNSPNDLVQARDGSIYFTDPPYGLAGIDDSPDKQQAQNGVYRWLPGGTVLLLDATLGKPNGIGIAPDGKTLYVANSDPDEPLWIAYALDTEGNVADRRVLFDGSALQARFDYGLPDGMAVAANGTLLASGPGGILALSPDGRLLGRIVTGQAAGNCTFGGDGSSLYITAGDRLLRVTTHMHGSVRR